MRLLLTTSLQLLHQPPLFHDSTKLKMLKSGSNNNNNNNNGTAMDDSIQALEITSPVNRTLNSGNKDKDKKVAATTTRYRECQKNHAASLGSHAVDGCGEFMPLGEEGSPDALKCAACGCHRNFHRREVEGEIATCDCHKKDAKKRGIQQVLAAATAMAYPSSVTQFQQGHKPPMTPIPMMAMSTGAADSDEQEGGGGVGGGGSPSNIKKRFRTKFSTEQKDEMYNFAEKLGWKMQKHDELAVQEFCANLGVKRHVLKVWMHNNKHTMAKKT
jgi:ZF-HD class homeobox domain-containing protein